MEYKSPNKKHALRNAFQFRRRARPTARAAKLLPRRVRRACRCRPDTGRDGDHLRRRNRRRRQGGWTSHLSAYAGALIAVANVCVRARERQALRPQSSAVVMSVAARLLLSRRVRQHGRHSARTAGRRRARGPFFACARAGPLPARQARARDHRIAARSAVSKMRSSYAPSPEGARDTREV